MNLRTNVYKYDFNISKVVVSNFKKLHCAFFLTLETGHFHDVTEHH